MTVKQYANTVNANFQNLDGRIQAIEDAGGGGGGCTVEQVDNSAEITCADGTTAVVPGYGTVVVYPEGTVGEIPPIDYNTGPVVVYDANDVVLGEVVTTSNAGVPIIEVLGVQFPRAALFNEPISESVILTASNPVSAFYLQSDCLGLPFVENEYDLIEVDGGHYVPDTSLGKENLLLASKRQKTGGSFSLVYDPASDCETLDLVKTVYPTAPYTPAPEILNAAYPVRLEQLP